MWVHSLIDMNPGSTVYCSCGESGDMGFVVRHVVDKHRQGNRRYYLNGGHAVWIRAEHPPYIKCRACDYWDFAYKIEVHGSDMENWELVGHGLPD
jgi:hypothetical protein